MQPEILTRRILACLVSYDEMEMARRMACHYQTLHLLDSGGNWASPLLETRSHDLLPGSVSFAECTVFLQQMMDHSLRNPFFASFLDRAVTVQFPLLVEKFRTEGHTVIPDALAFAMVLDRITHTCCEDFRILEVCYNNTKSSLRKTGALHRAPFFYQTKMRSIDPVIYFTIQAHKRPPEKLGKGSASRFLQINILEAVFSDLLMGLNDNVRAGWVLTVHKAGNRKVDPLTGAGPNYWSADGRTICLRHPFQKTWADLYQLWNMAFVSKTEEFPYVISKLLIPEVSGYANQPDTYMYKRIIALYLYMAWYFFDRYRRLIHHLPLLKWYDPALTSFWGSCSREAASGYAAMVHPSGRG